MAIRVIGAGMGRTGTMSLKVALEQVGFNKCYHMLELLQNPHQVHHWETASAGGQTDWDSLFEGYEAAVDYPACMYYRELAAKYPDAKVVLTVRDPEKWYESASQTIFQVSRAREETGPSSFPFPGDPELFRRIFGMIQRDIWGRDFAGRFEDREFAIARFNEHVEQVKEHVPADRLLVYQVREGWEPLCEFLGVPVPEGQPFPRLNDRETFIGRLRGQGEEQSSAGAPQP